MDILRLEDEIESKNTQMENYISEISNLKQSIKDKKMVIDNLKTNNFQWGDDFQKCFKEAQEFKEQVQVKDNKICELKQNLKEKEESYKENIEMQQVKFG